MQIYALTKRDVQWIGMAAAVAGGGVTAWNENDVCPILHEDIEEMTGREFLGTMPGLDSEKKVSKENVKKILERSKKDLLSMKKDDYFLVRNHYDIYIKPLNYRIKQIEKWMRS